LSLLGKKVPVRCTSAYHHKKSPGTRQPQSAPTHHLNHGASSKICSCFATVGLWFGDEHSDYKTDYE